MSEKQPLEEILNSKTDRELIEESIHQNIAINKKINTIYKRIGFIQFVVIVEVVATVLYVINMIMKS